MSNFVKSVSKISVPVLTGDFITVKSASWYTHNFDNFFKNVHNMLESGLTKVLLNLEDV